MAEIIGLKGQDYRTGQLNAFQQFHISRRLAPVFAVMGSKAAALVRAPREVIDDEVRLLDEFVELLTPMSEVLSRMSDEDTNYVLHTCLSVCSRAQGEGRYQQVLAQGQLMFGDIDMDVMLRLVIAVLQENLAGFLKGLGGSTPSPSP